MILVPFTKLHPGTTRLLDLHAPGHQLAQIDPADMSAYWRLVAEAWRQPGDLVIIEHDIGISAGVLPGFASCREPWCGHPYRIDKQMLVCLGCTRFTAALKTAEPDLLEVVGEDGTGGFLARHWKRLDVRILDELRKRGYTQHEHSPPVDHYHEYPVP